jgi:type IV secretion system protein TrbL
MNATILDDITQAFVTALQGGTQTLAAYSLPLLLVFATIAFYLQVGSGLMSGAVAVADALGGLLLLVLKIGVFYWLLVFLPQWTTAAYETFLLWGAAPTAATFSNATFFQPSALVNLGFAVAGDLYDMANRLSIWTRLNHPFLLWGYSIAYFLTVLAFALIALHLMMTIIEFNLAVLAGTVLIPWGVLHPTAFLTEFSLGWLTGGLVRVLVTGAIVGIGRPLFSAITTTLTVGGDPTAYSALVVAIASGIYTVLAWVVPGRAAAIAGRGVSLALHGGTLLSTGGAILQAASSPLRGVLLAQSAIRGVSALVRR